MANLNVIHLIGRVARDVELRFTAEGKAMAKFSLAVDKFGKDKGASFFNCTAWEKRAETLAKFLKKGHLVYISGRMESREGTTETGEKRTYWDLNVGDFQFLQSKDGAEKKPSPRDDGPFADLDE